MQLCSPRIMQLIESVLGLSSNQLCANTILCNDLLSGKMHNMIPPVSFPTIKGIPNPVIFGIDIPIFYPADEPIGTVVLIGQDPLRNPNNIILTNNGHGYINTPYNSPNKPSDVIVGTPFALHLYNNPNGIPQSYKFLPMYNDIVDGYLAKGYNVYLTDISKLYIKDANAKANDSFKVLMKDPYRQDCVNLLCEEIFELQKTQKVVGCIFYGTTAYNRIKMQLRNCSFMNNITIMNPIHPSDMHYGKGHWNSLTPQIDPHNFVAKARYIVNLIP